MNTLALVLFAALNTQSVYCNHYHGPIAKPVVLHNGYLADTHEVAAARKAHISTLAQHSHYGHEGRSYGYSHNNDQINAHESHKDIRYHGPTAIPHILHDGHIADTQEVAAAKAEHFAAVAKAKSHGGHGDEYNVRYASGFSADQGNPHHVTPYHGPLAKPVVLNSGYLADTHEVAVTKKHHLEALNNANHYDHYNTHY